jgi:hypothetical protein
MGKRSAGRQGRAPMRARAQAAPCAVSAPLSCAEAGIPAAGEHGGQGLHVSASNPLDAPVTGDTWGRQARSPAARSQNDGYAALRMRAGLRWRWWSMPCPRRLRLPHPWRGPLPRAQHAPPWRCPSEWRALWHTNCALADARRAYRTGTAAYSSKDRSSRWRSTCGPSCVHPSC